MRPALPASNKRTAPATRAFSPSTEPWSTTAASTLGGIGSLEISRLAPHCIRQKTDTAAASKLQSEYFAQRRPALLCSGASGAPTSWLLPTNLLVPRSSMLAQFHRFGERQAEKRSA